MQSVGVALRWSQLSEYQATLLEAYVLGAGRVRLPVRGRSSASRALSLGLRPSQQANKNRDGASLPWPGPCRAGPKTHKGQDSSP
jgi:hypothetical protein